MFAWFTDDRGSFAGYIACAVWQSLHLAVTPKPSALTWPWYVSPYVSTSFSWHEPHSFTMPTNHVESAAGTTLWPLWQSMHTGASCPVSVCLCFASATPCDDESNVASMPAWHVPQVWATLSRLIEDRAESAGSTRCAPWQSLHVAETTRPSLVSAVPWTVRL